MPLPAFTDVARRDEFKALEPAKQREITDRYWSEYQAENPDDEEYAVKQREIALDYLDTKSKLDSAAPVERRLLGSRAEDAKFMLALREGQRLGKIDQATAASAYASRQAERKDQLARLDKTRSLFDPKVSEEMAPAWDALKETAARGGVFGPARLDAVVEDFGIGLPSEPGVQFTSKKAYESLRNQLATDFNLEPGEVDDVVRHQLNLQPEPVSRDAFGTPYIKDEVIAAGPEAATAAINQSNLPWPVKQGMVQDLPKKIEAFQASTLKRVREGSPALAAELGVAEPGKTPQEEAANFQTVVKTLNDSRTEQFGGGLAAAAAATVEFIDAISPDIPQDQSGIFRPATGMISPEAQEQRKTESRSLRKKIELVNQLSSQFNKSKTEIFGTDAATYGSGAYSVAEAVGIGMLTAGAGTPFSVARIASMGKTGARLATFANGAIAVSPVAGFAGAKTAASTYESAIDAGMSEDRAFDLALRSGLIEAGVTMIFSGAGAGGLEDVAGKFTGAAARQAIRDSSASAWKAFGGTLAKGVTAEQFEEGMIAALDAVSVQAKIDPTMTVDDFKKQMIDTAKVTLAVSGPVVGLGAIQDIRNVRGTQELSDDELQLAANLNLAEAADPLRDRVRREGGVGTAVGERLRRQATQPGAANLPPTGQAAADATEDGGAPAPGAPAPVAPGGTQPVAPAQGPTGASAGVPGVQPVGAAEPVLVPADADVNRQLVARGILPPPPTMNPEERQTYLRENAPDLAAPTPTAPAAPAAPAAPEAQQELVGRYESPEGVASSIQPDLPQGYTATPEVSKFGNFSGRVSLAFDGVEVGHVTVDYDYTTQDVRINKSEIQEGHRGKGLAKKTYIAINDALVSQGLPPLRSDNRSMTQDAVKLWRSLERDGLARERTDGTRGFEFVSTPTTDETAPVQTPPAAETAQDTTGRGPGVPAPMGEAGPAAAQDTPVVEAQEPPVETAAEPEPNMTEVFETLRERDPETQPVNTQSPRFQALVTELKDKRAAEMAGGMAQRVADIAEMRAEAKAAREAREKEFRKEQKAIKDRRKAKQAEKPLDRQRRRILELTKDPVTGKSVSPDYEAGLLEWLRARGYTGGLVKNDLRTMMGEKGARSTPKEDALRQMYFAQTPEVQEVLQSYLNMSQKGKEQHPELQAFENTPIGSAILQEKLKSRSWFRRNKVKPPPAYEKLKKHGRIRAHLASSIFNDNGVLPEDISSGFESGSYYGGMSFTVSEDDVVQAIIDLDNGMIATEEDADAQAEKDFQEFEKQQQEAENREIAFAEQQLEASGNENNQTVDLREVRDGDRFTIGGVEYTATGVVADERGRTESFTLFSFDPETATSGPLSGTEVAEDFFAEGVVPTAGSISHIDPAEIEAISIAQEFPEEFEAEAAAPAPEPAPAPQDQTTAPQAQTPEAPEPTQQQAPEPAKEKPDEAKAKAEPPPPPAEPAAPAPAAEIPEGAVGTANVMTNQMRARRGMPPRADQARLGNEQAWDAAMEILDGDPNAGAVLVDQLTTSPRSIDPVDTSLFTHELLVRENALDKALDLYNRSPNAKNLEAVQLAETAVRDAILTAERIGTIEGRALQARKILVHQDFSFGRLAARQVKAQGGKELSEDQTKELVELHKQLDAIRQQLEIANAEIAEQEAQQLTLNIQNEFKKELKDAKKRGEKPMSVIERAAEAARARMAARKQEGRLNALPVTDFGDMVIIGVSYIAKGFNTVGSFTAKLVKDFGRKYAPFAADIFAKSQELYETAAPSSRVKPKEDILSAIDKDAPLDGKAIYQLVRHYINEDVEGATFDGVMDAVLADLKDVYPDLDRRQLHVAYSNYGKVTQPDPAEDAKKARDYRSLARLLSQLEDAQRGLAPLKTGRQRDLAIQAVRDLEKEVRDTMKRLGIQPTNENNQRKNTLDAIKTRLRNEFEDLDKAVKTGVPRPAYQSQTEYDEEAKRLKQRRDDRKADYDAIFKAPGLTQEQQLERAEKLLDRRIAEERKLLAEGLLQRARDVKMGPWTPELRARQRELDQLKADRRERQKAAKPKKPEDQKKYERDLASLEKRIKEEEALLAAGLTARQRDIRMGRWTPQMAELQARLDTLRDQRRALAESLRPTKDEAVAAYEKATKAIEASIERYKEIIAGIAKPAPGKKYTPDAEMLALIDQRDALRDAVAVLRESDPARIDKRKQAAVKALEKSVIEITRKIQDGDLSTRSKSDPFASDPDIVKLRASRDLLNKVMADLRQMKMPKRTPEEIAINRDKANLYRRIEKLEKRIRTKDYSKPVKSSPPSYATRDALVKRKKDLESQFNDDLLQAELAQRGWGKKLFDNTTDVVFGVSRAMLTSFDAGAFGRQGGLVNFMRPGITFGNMAANFAFSEKAASRYEDALESDPNYARALASKLAITSWRPGSSLDDREEVYRSRLAKKIPGVGASERAYVTYLNVVRFSYFNKLVETLSATEQTEANLQRIASHVNTMTGRGNLGKMEGSAAAFAAVFFSPKYWWSRLQILGGLVYHPLDAMTGFRLGKDETRAARKIVAGEYGRLIAGVGVFYSLIALAKFGFGWDDDEFEVVIDPRSSDFGKIKIGNTRIDPMAGLLQNVVFISRFVSGEKVNAEGEKVAISGAIERKFGQNRLTETIRLLRTKLSPAAGSIVNFMDEQDVVGNKFTLETEILGSYIPMSIAETYASMRELGLAPGVAAGLLGFVGYSANTYGGEEKGTVIEQDIFTGKILEPFGITPGEFFIDQSRYEEEKREPVYKLPKPKPLPGL